MVTFWPRQEVLQLIIQQLANSGGKVLTNELVITVVKQLSKSQTPEGNISFDRWLVVAKDLLRWNDSCLQLFWEMLLMALSYSKDDVTINYAESGVRLAYLAIFLVLHTSDLQARSNLPGSNYDTVWPDTEAVMSPSSAPISSPSKIHGLNIRLLPSSGPPSPKSPVSSPKSGHTHSVSMPTSPKRMNSMSPRQCKPASHYLYAIRQKLPIILRAITIDASALGSDNADSISLAMEGLGGAGVSGTGSGSSVLARGLEFMVSRKAVDSLGLILSGGSSRDGQVVNISNLHPIWALEDVTYENSKNSDVIDRTKYVPYSELSEWLDSNMSLNDSLHPSYSILSPLFSPGMGLMSPKLSPLASYEETSSNGTNSPSGHGDTIVFPTCEAKPYRIFDSMCSLPKAKPTVISGCTTTIMHITTSIEKKNAKNSGKSDENLSNQNQNQTDDIRMNKGQSRKNTSSLSSAMNVSDQYTDQTGDNADSLVESDGAMSEGVSMDVPISSDGIAAGSGSGSGSDSLDPFNSKESSVKGRADIPGGRSRGRSDATNEEDDTDSGGENFISSRLEEGVEDLDALKGYSVRRRRRRRKEGGSIGCLPPLHVTTSQGAHMLFLSAYSCASIINCSDCEIVIGAVSGAVVLRGCERIKITVACRKLIVHNCLECEIYLATLSPSVIAGDSRSLTFGPFNTAYKHHRSHLRATGLSALYEVKNCDSPTHSEGKSNFWSSLCDVNTCLEAVSSSSSPSGYAIDAADQNSFSQLLPTPPASTASLIAPDKFKFLAIPCRTEYLPMERCAISLPMPYHASIDSHKSAIMSLNERLEALSQSEPGPEFLNSGSKNSGINSGSGSGSSSLKNTDKADTMKYVSAKFMEWLIATDKVQHVLDLVKIDGERIVGTSAGTGLGIGLSGNSGNAGGGGGGGGGGGSVGSVGINRSRSNDTCDSVINSLVLRSDLSADGKRSCNVNNFLKHSADLGPIDSVHDSLHTLTSSNYRSANKMKSVQILEF